MNNQNNFQSFETTFKSRLIQGIVDFIGIIIALVISICYDFNQINISFLVLIFKQNR